MNEYISNDAVVKAVQFRVTNKNRVYHEVKGEKITEWDGDILKRDGALPILYIVPNIMKLYSKSEMIKICVDDWIVEYSYGMYMKMTNEQFTTLFNLCNTSLNSKLHFISSRD